jgi:hypothetical protein
MSLYRRAVRVLQRLRRRGAPGPRTATVVDLDTRRMQAARDRHPAGKARRAR